MKHSPEQTGPQKTKKLEIFIKFLSDQNAMKLEINNRRIIGKFTNMRKLNNTLLDNQWVKKKNRNQ